MTTYTDVTALPSVPASVLEADTHVNLVQSGMPEQKYIYSAGPTGAWIAVTDEDDVIATDAVFLQQVTQKFMYDYAVDGGGVGNITLRGGTVPSGAIVTGAVIDVYTAITGATLAEAGITCQSSGDISSPLDITTFPGVGVGAMIIVAATSSLNMFFAPVALCIKTTQARSIVLNVTIAALLGGKFDLYITYMVPA